MVRALTEQLAAWADDPAVTRVIVTAAGGRAFSAGGDLRALYELGRAGRYDEALAFWRDEYRLNALIKRYRKPYVALIDGVVMGGGVGDVDPRVAPRCRRRLPLCDAGGRDRILPRRGRDLVPAAPAGRARHVLRADRRAARTRRWGWLRHCHPSRQVGAVRRTWSTRSAARYRSTRCWRRSRNRPARGRSRAAAGDRPAVSRRIAIEDILAALDADAASRRERDFARTAAAAIRGKVATSLKIALAQAAARPNARFRRVHAHRIPHSFARRARA